MFRFQKLHLQFNCDDKGDSPEFFVHLHFDISYLTQIFICFLIYIAEQSVTPKLCLSAYKTRHDDACIWNSMIG